MLEMIFFKNMANLPSICPTFFEQVGLTKPLPLLAYMGSAQLYTLFYIKGYIYIYRGRDIIGGLRGKDRKTRKKLGKLGRNP